jgi:signal transduction histidine kinase
LKLGNIPEIECIPSQINQVFMNLIINASQAMEKGKIGIITIRSGVIESNSSMTLNDLPERVWFEVEDNGAGISATNLTKIFDPFFTTKEVGLGTGLGLSVSHGIILKHKGELTVKSELGSGTVFRIVLPVFQLS